MINKTQYTNDKFIKVCEQIRLQIIQCFAEENECNTDDLLEEDIEACQVLTTQVISILMRPCKKQELVEKLMTGVTLYNYFNVKLTSQGANMIVENLISLCPDLKKYAKLAAIELEKYHDGEAQRLRKMEAELEFYLGDLNKE
jgi:hypothetical protein